MKWNDDWRQECEKNYYATFERLCECRNTKNDIVIMTRLMYKYNKERFTKEECFDRMLEWCGSWNSQEEIFDITMNEYKEMLTEI